jgi:hypothetical protein
MAETFKRLVARRPGPEEVDAARYRVHAALYGDLALATARAAARPFVATLPGAAELLAVPADEVARAAGALPSWAALPRFATGPAPHVVVPVPAPGGVRKSPTPTPAPV